MKLLVALATLSLSAGHAWADAPVIKDVTLRQAGGAWTFDVTLMHGDTGWDDYANGWRVLDPEGRELGVRILAHPHVDEQPFTRSLSGVRVPDGVTEVGIQASDTVGGWSSAVRRVRLQ